MDTGWAAPLIAWCSCPLAVHLVHDNVADFVIAGNVPGFAKLRVSVSAPAIHVHKVALGGEPHGGLQAESRGCVALSLEYSELTPLGLLEHGSWPAWIFGQNPLARAEAVAAHRLQSQLRECLASAKQRWVEQAKVLN